MTPHGIKITLFLSRMSAERAGNAAINNNVLDFVVTQGRVQWADGSADTGFKVSLRGHRNQHLGYL